MLRSGRICVLVLSCLFAVACKGPEDDTVSDSAPAVWQLADEAEIEMGAGDDGFVYVTSAVRLATGLVVADAGAAEVRWYDAAGGLVRTAGRRGSGPGEFVHLASVVALSGDSVAAWDASLSRLSVFDADGRFVRSVAVPGAKGVLSSVAGRLADGTLVLSVPLGRDGRGARRWRDSTFVIRVDAATGAVDTVARLAGMEFYAQPGTDRLIRIAAVPLGRAAVVAVGDEAIFAGSADTYEIVRYAPDGAVEDRVSHPHRPVTLRDADRDAFLGNLLESTDDAERVREIRDTPFPETLPPYTGIAAGPDGMLWVREPALPSAPDQSSRWSVFDADGRWIAAVTGPPRVKTLQVGSDWMLVDAVAEDDTERVRVYRIIRP